MVLYLVYGVAATVILAYFLEYYISSKDDVREPSRIRAKIPLIGHLLGIITSGPSYHSTLKYTPLLLKNLCNYHPLVSFHVH